MQIPAPLRRAIEEAASRHPLRDLKHAAATLSQRYQKELATDQVASSFGRKPFIQSEIERCAYAATRMPATYAAARKALSELQRLWPDGEIRRWLDLGAGTGAASWAVAETFAAAQQATLIERDAGLLQLGRSLAQAAAQTALRAANWQQAHLQQVRAWPSQDLVIASYALGELEPEHATQVVRVAWQATEAALLVLEPGTVRGFATVRRLRDELLRLGGHLLAPCPHAQACPLPEGDWCHFAARVERTALQRNLKGGSLGHEDEKFAYLIVTKKPLPRATARLLRHPLRQPGQAELQLCTNSGLHKLTVKKRDATWRQARKAEWGDAWES